MRLENLYKWKENWQTKMIISLLLISLLFVFAQKNFDRDKKSINDKAIVELENENAYILNEQGQLMIRVLISSSYYKNLYHDKLEIEGENLIVSTSDEEIKCNSLDIDSESELLIDGVVKIEAEQGGFIKIKSIKRSYGEAIFEGTIEVYLTENKLAIVNEIPLETYLKYVLPSEVPSSFEVEALKAQVVCNRSYAYNQMVKLTYPEYEAHVNDSTDFQVFNNVLGNERTNQAVVETSGEKLAQEGEVVTTYFFSTSCGYTTDVTAWGTKNTDKYAYLKSIKVGDAQDYEKDLPWYKWTIELSIEELEKILELNLESTIGKLEDVVVLSEGPGGVLLKLKIIGSQDEVTIEGENAIRKVFGSDTYKITKNDGSKESGRTLLPSAFFTIEIKNEKVLIEGGGFGHGIGMSQYGANEMAKIGMNYEEILTTFYNGTELIK